MVKEEGTCGTTIDDEPGYYAEHAAEQMGLTTGQIHSRKLAVAAHPQMRGAKLWCGRKRKGNCLVPLGVILTHDH